MAQPENWPLLCSQRRSKICLPYLPHFAENNLLPLHNSLWTRKEKTHAAQEGHPCLKFPATAFSILLFTETRKLSGFFLKKKPPCTISLCQHVNRKCSKGMIPVSNPAKDPPPPPDHTHFLASPFTLGWSVKCSK
jgi:hypothetical protein